MACVLRGSACGPVIVPVFKTGGRRVPPSPVGSTPTRFRHRFCRKTQVTLTTCQFMCRRTTCAGGSGLWMRNDARLPAPARSEFPQVVFNVQLKNMLDSPFRISYINQFMSLLPEARWVAAPGCYTSTRMGVSLQKSTRSN